jgi:hypothetical protein
MDIDTIDDVIFWINRQSDWQAVTTEDVIARSRDATLPADAKAALANLRSGTWTRADLVAEVRTLMVAQITR